MANCSYQKVKCLIVSTWHIERNYIKSYFLFYHEYLNPHYPLSVILTEVLTDFNRMRFSHIPVKSVMPSCTCVVIFLFHIFIFLLSLAQVDVEISDYLPLKVIWPEYASKKDICLLFL